jgi:hypothetical protein
MNMLDANPTEVANRLSLDLGLDVFAAHDGLTVELGKPNITEKGT